MGTIRPFRTEWRHDGGRFLVTSYFLCIYCAGVESSPLLLRSLIGLLYQAWMMIVEQSVEWMIGRWNRNTRKKLAAVPLCPPQIPHDLARAWIRVAAVITAWATAQPCEYITRSFTTIIRRSGCALILFSPPPIHTACLPKTPVNAISF
jgi:hypothetical protein